MTDSDKNPESKPLDLQFCNPKNEGFGEEHLLILLLSCFLQLWNPWVCTYIATPVLILFTSGLVYLEGSASNVALYLLLVFFITFVGPYWLIKSQKYKNEISGPWDIPSVKSYS
ncbi:hypothetical protein ACSSS7_000697 [Eimeria intestinalis]